MRLEQSKCPCHVAGVLGNQEEARSGAAQDVIAVSSMRDDGYEPARIQGGEEQRSEFGKI